MRLPTSGQPSILKNSGIYVRAYVRTRLKCLGSVFDVKFFRRGGVFYSPLLFFPTRHSIDQVEPIYIHVYTAGAKYSSGGVSPLRYCARRANDTQN